MDSPFSVPCIDHISEFDGIPLIEQKARSFDNADIDLTYSEDVSTVTNSPLAAISILPRITEKAPKLPNPPPAAITMTEGFTMNRINHRNRRLEERDGRQHVCVDYDLSDDEDILLGDTDVSLVDDEGESSLPDDEGTGANPLEISYDTAPVYQSKPLLRKENTRSASFSTISPITSKDAFTTTAENALDLTVPPLTPPVPIRRVSSTPMHQFDRPLQSRLQITPPVRRRDSSSQLPVHSPYALRRQVSLPIKTVERRSPTIKFTDNPQQSMIDGESTPKSRNRSQGASIFRSGRNGNLASPGGVQTPSPSKASQKIHRRDCSLENLTLSAPYALRRPSSVPVTSMERKSPIIRFSDDPRPTARIEFKPPNQNQRAGVLNTAKVASVAPSDDNVKSSRRKGSTVTEEWPGIKENPTSVTDYDTDVELAGHTIAASDEKDITQGSLHVDHDMADSDTSTRSKDEKVFFQRQKMRYVLYLSAFSIFGNTIRAFLDRIFGLSCETSNPDMDEFCIAASGTTMQRGGALFIDLPANMVGCFIMGLMTSLQPDLWPPLPWFRSDHPLQQHDAYHVAIRTGLCGCITTFASWNAQMVVMMDGTATQLGSQVVSALFGYVVGFFCAIASFLVGTHVSTWLTRWRNPDIAHEDDEVARFNSVARMEHDGEYSHDQSHDATSLSRIPPASVIVMPTLFGAHRSWRGSLCCKGHLLPFVLVTCLLLAYGVAGFVMGNPLYRTLFYSSLFTPPGALLRWEMSKWNTRFAENQWRRFRWLPIGTFVANISASVVSILLLAIETRYLFDDEKKGLRAISIITALRTGFAGSLSTVSTMVKEMFELNAEFPRHAKAYHYALLTVSVAVVLSMSVYSPIVRSG